MDTIINPIQRDYDLDDGIYFIGQLSKENRPAPSTYHTWIIDAIGNHTNQVIDKDTCVRVVYSEGYHIDLPIYYASYYNPDLAHKKAGWILSNPIEFVEWFETKAGSGFKQEYLFEVTKQAEYRKWAEDVRKLDVQLRRVVRYLKGWADFKNNGEPSGIILTILATENFQTHFRDDIALYETIKRIRKSLSSEFVCRRPTTPKGEDLFLKYDTKAKKSFLTSLDELIKSAGEAITETDKKKSCSLWKDQFGPRFPCHLVNGNDDMSSDRYSSVKTIAAPSVPWSF
jgi:hypothetical protein